MTTITLHRGRDGRLRGYTVSGHTGSAPQGEDIVCAGVSAIAQACANAIESIAGIQPKILVKAGYLSLRLPRRESVRKDRAAQVILRTAEQGFSDIAKAHPEYVRIRN